MIRSLILELIRALLVAAVAAIVAFEIGRFVATALSLLDDDHRRAIALAWLTDTLAETWDYLTSFLPRQ